MREAGDGVGHDGDVGCDARPHGIDGELLDVVWPVHNALLRYSGFEVLQPFITHAPGKTDDGTRAQILRRYDERLRHG